MSGWDIAGIVLAIIVLGLLIMNARDIYRYIKISNM
jgi:hypothetical protein